MQLPRPRHGQKRVPQFAKGIATHLSALSGDGAHGLILSEENIPGPMRHFYEGRFFPASGKRLAALAAAFEAPPVHMLYVVRPYGELYVSAHRKRAEDNAVTPFDELVPHFLAMDRGWPELLAEMRDVMRPERLTVLTYAQRGESRGLLQRLVPDLANVDLVEPERVMNLSATDAALMALQTRYRGGETIDRAAWRQVIGAHADDQASRGFAEFDAGSAAQLDAVYRRDLERIAAMDGIEVM